MCLQDLQMKFLTTQLRDIPWIRHGFFSKRGGVSEGPFAGLNCALTSGDRPDHIRANRTRVAETMALQPDALITARQVHSPDAVYVTEAWAAGQTPDADGLVTDKPGLGIAVLTADCAPVFFASRKDKIIGVAHAGWKGALTGVLDATVKRMTEQGAALADISAAIGPCIGPASYEVREDFAAPFIAQAADNQAFFKAGKPGHLYFNLPGYVAARLAACGIKEVQDIEQDTLPAQDIYYSYRRTTLRGGIEYGRQISVISICDTED